MKKYLVLMIIPFMLSCNNKDDKIKTLTAKNDSLISINNQKDKEINDFVLSMNQIQENIDLIKETEKMVTMNAKGDIENNDQIKEKIESDIQLIYQLMQNNKKTIADLSKKLKSSNHKISEFAKTIDFLNKKIMEDSVNINNLRIELEGKNIRIGELESTVDTLIVSNKTKTKKIEEQTEKLNTVYYIIGSEKELKEKQILSKEGGFIGLGKNMKVKGDFDLTEFTKINLNKVTQIKLGYKKVKILSTHPSSSYQLEQEAKKISNLNITNSEKFWSKSIYLVIVIEK